jgi:hypothetical protein
VALGGLSLDCDKANWDDVRSTQVVKMKETFNRKHDWSIELSHSERGLIAEPQSSGS